METMPGFFNRLFANPKRFFLIGFSLMEFGMLVYAFLIARQTVLDNAIDQFHNQQFQSTTIAASAIENDIHHTLDKLTLISHYPEIEGGSSDACNSRLDQAFSTTLLLVRSLSRINSGFIIDCSTKRDIIGLSRKTSPGFQEVFSDPKHPTFITFAIASPVDQKQVSGIVLPINSGGTFTGILNGAILLESLYDRYLQKVSFLEDTAVVIFDSNGDILSYKDPSLIGKNATYTKTKFPDNLGSIYQAVATLRSQDSSGIQFVDINGSDTVLAWSQAKLLPNRTWTVVSAIPETKILASLTKSSLSQGLSVWLKFSIVVNLTIIIVSGILAVFFNIGLLTQVIFRLVKKFFP